MGPDTSPSTFYTGISMIDYPSPASNICSLSHGVLPSIDGDGEGEAPVVYARASTPSESSSPSGSLTPENARPSPGTVGVIAGLIYLLGFFATRS